MHGGFMDNTEVNISQEIPAYEEDIERYQNGFLIVSRLMQFLNSYTNI